MATYDNSGKKIGEITVIIRPGEGTITTNTVFSSTVVSYLRISRLATTPGT